MPGFAFEAETAAFVATVEAAPPTEGLSIDQLRDGYRSTVIANSAAGHEDVDARDLAMPAGARAVAARLYTPAAVASVGPLLIYVHGGGFAVGDLTSHDKLVRLVAAAGGIRVLALDYRLAPEHPFPAALDDVLAAFAWAAANAASLGVDPARIAIGGESAGGTHAVAATLSLVAAGGPRPRVLWVLVPALDAAGTGLSHTMFATGAGRTATEFAYLWSLYLPDAVMRHDARAVPALADPRGLPTTLVYTAEFDPARSDGEDFAERARAAGVDVRLKREVGLVHQFPEITGLSPASHAAIVAAARDLAAALDQA